MKGELEMAPNRAVRYIDTTVTTRNVADLMAIYLSIEYIIEKLRKDGFKYIGYYESVRKDDDSDNVIVLNLLDLDTIYYDNKVELGEDFKMRVYTGLYDSYLLYTTRFENEFKKSIIFPLIFSNKCEEKEYVTKYSTGLNGEILFHHGDIEVTIDEIIDSMALYNNKYERGSGQLSYFRKLTSSEVEKTTFSNNIVLLYNVCKISEKITHTFIDSSRLIEFSNNMFNLGLSWRIVEKVSTMFEIAIKGGKYNE